MFPFTPRPNKSRNVFPASSVRFRTQRLFWGVHAVAAVNVRSWQYWQMRAEEALSRARGMHDPDAIDSMLDIAVRCERMARRIEQRQARLAAKPDGDAA